MYTAAEALRMSDVQLVTTGIKELIFRFNEELKIWECKQGDGFRPSRGSSEDFVEKNFLPVMAEKSELDKAKAKEKYLGKWVKVKGRDISFKVDEVEEKQNTIMARTQAYDAYDISRPYMNVNEIELLELELELEPSNTWGKGRCCVEDAPSEDMIVYVKIKMAIMNTLYEDTIQVYADNEWQECFKPEKGDLWWPLPEGEG